MSSFYNLNNIDSSLGKELLNVSAHKKISITFVVFPQGDLVSFASSLTFLLHVPDDYHIHYKGVELEISSQSLMEVSVQSIFEPYTNAEDHDKDFIPICIPWLSSLPMSDLSIVFYAVRLLLRCPEAPCWLAPATITNKLVQTGISSSTLNSSMNNKKTFTIICGAGRSRGKRQYMEDREFTFPNVRMAADKVSQLSDLVAF
jgi:hypothetical protein